MNLCEQIIGVIYYVALGSLLMGQQLGMGDNTKVKLCMYFISPYPHYMQHYSLLY